MKKNIVCLCLKAADRVEEGFTHQGRHPRRAVDSQQVRRQVDTCVTRPEVHLQKIKSQKRFEYRFAEINIP